MTMIVVLILFLLELSEWIQVFKVSLWNISSTLTWIFN
jgi:hypothetical protein